MDGITIAYNASKGRHIVATKAFAPGQLVLEQEPYAAVLYDEHVPGRCDHCFEVCETPLRCGRSRLARYCSREHQRIAWNQGYKQECDSLVKLAPKVPPPTVRLAARVLWRRQREQQQAGAAPQHLSYAAVDSLLHHWEHLDDIRKSLYAQMAVVTWQYLHGNDKLSPAEQQEEEESQHQVKTEQQQAEAPTQQHQQQAAAGGQVDQDTASGTSTSTINTNTSVSTGIGNIHLHSSSSSSSAATSTAARLPSIKEIALLIARFACNNHTICDEELRPMGAGLYPLGALVNHSCSPNCMQSFVGAKIQFRAVRPIAPGEEVCIAYVELAASLQERREQLAATYFFDPWVSAGGSSTTTISASSFSMSSSSSRVAGSGTGADTSASSGVLGSSHGAGASAAGVLAAEDAAVRMQSMHVDHEPGSSSTHTNTGQAASSLSSSSSRLCSKPPALCVLPLPGGAVLHLHGAGKHPPWTCDPRDTQLTQLLLLVLPGATAGGPAATARGAGAAAATASAAASSPLEGGVWAHAAAVDNTDPGLGFEVEEPVALSGQHTGGPDSDSAMPQGSPLSMPQRSPLSMPQGSPLSMPQGSPLSMHRGGPLPSATGHLAAALASDRAGGIMQGDASLHGAGAQGSRRSEAEAARGGGAGGGGTGNKQGGGQGKAGTGWRVEVHAWGAWTQSLLIQLGADTSACTHADGRETAQHLQQQQQQQQQQLMDATGVVGIAERCACAAEALACGQAAADQGLDRQALSHLHAALASINAQPGRPPTASLASTTPQTVQQQQQQQLALGPCHLLRMRINAAILRCTINACSSHPGPDPDASHTSRSLTHSSTGGSGRMLTAAADGSGDASGPNTWRAALAAARALVPAYELCYPGPAWPNMALHWATLAKLEQLLEHPRKALRASEAALSQLSITHGHHKRLHGGSSSSVLDQARHVQYEAGQELRALALQGMRQGEESEEEG